MIITIYGQAADDRAYLNDRRMAAAQMDANMTADNQLETGLLVGGDEEACRQHRQAHSVTDAMAEQPCAELPCVKDCPLDN